MNKIVKLLALMLSLLSYSWLTAVEVKPLKEFTLSQNEDIIIEKPGSFIVTEDNRIVVNDGKAGNIKIFDMQGKRIDIFGRKGMGPHEFVRPWGCAYKDPFIAFVDYGRKTIFLYKYSKETGFEFIQKFLCLYLGYDFHLIDDQNILIAGEKFDENQRLYSLYQYNFKEDKYDFILPSETAYGYTSIKKFMKDNDEKLAFIGSFLYFDFSDDSIYLIWKGNLNVIKIDRKTGKVVKRFGMKTENYVQPYYTPEIKKAFRRKDHRLLYKLDRPMSMVKDILVSKGNKVGVIYVGPFNSDDQLEAKLQFYTDEGIFLKEIKVLTAGASHPYEIYFYFRKSDNRLFILDTETSKEFNQSFKIYEYGVNE